MYSFKRFRFLLLLPVAVVIIGTIGMMAIEHLSLLDALYFTIVTIATVGYGDITAATTGGKIFSIFLIVIGIGVFLTLLTNVVEWLVHRQQNAMHRHRLNMLIGVFFTEAGNQLLHTFTGYDPDIGSIRREFIVTAQWSEKEYEQLRRRLNAYEHTVDPKRLDLDKLYRYLDEKKDLLTRQLENADLVENETYAELLWAVVHLHDELAARSVLVSLPETDIAHIANDIKRAYALLTRQWLDYMLYLKNRYPFLFSLALRTNPFVENPSAVVK
ncbi:MAG: potassium channel family protein [Dehalococcoidales bacterium]